MRKPFTKLYLHLVWSTWNRAPLLTPALHQAVGKCLRAECVKLGVNVEAFGGVADHVHLLVRLPTTVSVADLVKQVKGSSSHLISQRLRVPFKWQGRYGAFTVSPSHLPRVRDYVLNQERHHADGSTHPMLEATEEDVRADEAA
ncbi:MAG TPA: IS200/IS605 family transposase [Longimicrobium sp.]|nr:IS200/IS605 family transposase [Longimicrobium sp.]